MGTGRPRQDIQQRKVDNMPVIDNILEALKTYNAQDIQCTVETEYKGFDIHCLIQDKLVHIEVVERLPMTGMYCVAVSSSIAYNVDEGKVQEMHKYVYHCEVRSILRTVTVALETLME